MSSQSKTRAESDPMGAATESWKQMQSIWMDGWSKMMGESVGTEQFSKMMGQWLDFYFGWSGPVRKQIEELTERSLEQMNLPTRAEMATIGKRLTSVEMRLDDIDAKVDDALAHLAAIREQLGATVARPATEPTAVDAAGEGAVKPRRRARKDA